MKASAYTIEEMVLALESAHSSLLDHINLTDEGKKTRKLKDYERLLKTSFEKGLSTVEKYPDDEEFRDYFNKFKIIMKKKKEGIPIEKEKKMIDEFLSEMSHLVHWRKLEISSGKDLPFRDYRTMKEGEKKRGV